MVPGQPLDDTPTASTAVEETKEEATTETA